MILEPVIGLAKPDPEGRAIVRYIDGFFNPVRRQTLDHNSPAEFKRMAG